MAGVRYFAHLSATTTAEIVVLVNRLHQDGHFGEKLISTDLFVFAIGHFIGTDFGTIIRSGDRFLEHSGQSIFGLSDMRQAVTDRGQRYSRDHNTENEEISGA
jgi:hypothetical protein